MAAPRCKRTLLTQIKGKEAQVKYLTVQEVASQLKVHENTVVKWLKTGKLYGVRFGKLWRIPASELDKVKEVKDDPT